MANARVRQIKSGTHSVEILYDLSGAPAEGATVSVAFGTSASGPFTTLPPASALSGDFGPGVKNGTNKRIIWYAPIGTCSDLAVQVTAATQQPEITITLPGNVPLVLVKIPKGTFWMGSPETERNRGSDETRHQVALTQDYYLFIHG